MNYSANRMNFALVRLLSLAAALCLSGCGLGTTAVPAASVSTADSPSMNGVLFGGPNPVIGATVSLYVTANNGYGGAATFVVSTTTASNGGFAFTLPGGFSCPAGQFAYVTSKGGNTGSNAVNANSLLMIPVGACETNYSGSTYTGPYLFMNELTTIASAYTLGNFMTISAGTANISAPANNNATTPCVSGVAGCTANAAAGLKHAFANALSLVNQATGFPSATNAHGGIIPVNEINLMGNILQSCVNTRGTTGTVTATANDATLCGKLFSLTTPPYTGAAVPTNTLQAMMNLAKYPTLQTNTWSTDCTTAGTGSTTANSCLFGLAAGIGVYATSLSSAPPDWGMTLVYPKGTGVVTGAGCATTCPGLTYPYGIALDISDNVYVTNNDSVNQANENLLGFAFDGTPLWTTAQDTVFKTVKNIATDGLGRVITANNGTGAAQLIHVTDASTGSLLTEITAAVASPYAVMADPSNNIWFTTSVAGAQNINQLAYTGTTGGVPTYSVTAFTSVPKAGQVPYSIAMDPSRNVWTSGASTTAGNAYLFPNTGSVGAPAYAGTLKTTATSYATLSGANFSIGIAPDANSNAWLMTFSGLVPITKTGSGDSVSLAGGTAVSVTTTSGRFAQTDGAGTIFTADYGNGTAVGGVGGYDTTHSVSIGLVKGCRVSLPSNVCGLLTTSAAVYGARGLAIDSSGDIWVVSAVSGSLTEFLGLAAPTWPALSLAKFGMPQ